MRLWIALAAAFLASEAAAAATSSYTSLDLDGCELVEAAPPQGPGAWARMRCEGLPGYPVWVADDDGRMSLDYGPAKAPGRWESFAAFNRVHDVVEWRIGEDGAPFATIHRWFVAGEGAERQVLVVSTVASEASPQSCVVGIVDTSHGGSNERARELADAEARTFRCGVDEPRYHGPVGPDAPTFAPASGAPPGPAEPSAAAEPFAAAEPDVALPGTPEALVRDYWWAAEAAAGPDDLARFRMAGAPPEHLFDLLTDLAARYRVASVQPLTASDAERLLAVVLRPRDGESVSPRSAEVSVIRLGGEWRIATEAW